MTSYAVTKCVENRRKLLANESSSTIIFDSLNFMRANDRMRLLGFCIMPDHLHLLFVLLSKCSLQELIRDFGRFTARQLNKIIESQGDFWQEGFHDHRCRNEDDILERLAYIEHNPVRAGLISKADDWRYSSAYPANQWLLDREWYIARR